MRRDLGEKVGVVLVVHVDAIHVGEVERRTGCIVRVLRVSQAGLLRGGIVGGWIEGAVSEGVDGRVGILCFADLENGTTANRVRTGG